MTGHRVHARGAARRSETGCLLLTLAIAVAGCSRAVPPPGAATIALPGAPAHSRTVVTATANGPARISAIHARGRGTFTIKWSAPGASSVQVRVSVDGAAAELFAEGGQAGSATASFIGPGHTYVFALFGATTSGSALASTVVREP